MKSKFNLILFAIMSLLFYYLNSSTFAYSKEKEAAKNKISEKDILNTLPGKYKEWMDLVYYIITPIEKEIFLSLKDDKSRDLFIEAFWKRRDPTPGTAENEFKQEHIRRFQWANKYLRDGAREGWKTDRGKFYIILGEPISKTKIETIDVYPAEIWYYYGEQGTKLPSHFALVFYRKGGSGEYKLYDPLMDGPDSLFLQRQAYNAFDYEKLYEKLKELSPSLADVALSPIPGEIPYNYQPTAKTSLLIKEIMELPKERIDTEYARNFAKYKGIVDVEYSLNYISNKNIFSIQPMKEAEYFFVHYAIELKTLSVDTYQDKYYTNLELNGAIKDKDGKIIFQYKKNYSLYFDEEQFDAIKKSGLVIEDIVPIITGSYKIQVLIKNTLSKEFTLAEADIEIPKRDPIFSDIILAYNADKDFSKDIKPYKISFNLLKVQPINIFTQSDTIYLYYGAKNLLQGNYLIKININDGAKIIKTFSKNIDASDGYYEELIQMRANEFSAGRYNVSIELYDNKGNKVAYRDTYFDVASVAVIARPNYATKIIPSKNEFLIWQIIGDEYYATVNYSPALEYYKKVNEIQRNFLPAVKRILEVYIALKMINEAVSFIENTNIKEKDADFYYLCGKVYEAHQDYDKAEKNYLESLRISRNANNLNALANLYIKLKRTEEAKKLLNEL